MRSPVEERVLPMRLTMTSRLSRGRLRQLAVLWQNMRCAILFHVLVPGGRWYTGRERYRLVAAADSAEAY